METAATGTLSNVAGSTHRFGGRVSFEYFDRLSHARRVGSEGTVSETFLNFAKNSGARAGLISGVELIWANGELDGKLSQIVDKKASSH